MISCRLLWLPFFCAGLLVSGAAGTPELECEVSSNADGGSCDDGSRVSPGMIQVTVGRGKAAHQSETKDGHHANLDAVPPVLLVTPPPPAALVANFSVPPDVDRSPVGQDLETAGPGEEGCDPTGDHCEPVWEGDILLFPEEQAAMLAINTSRSGDLNGYNPGGGKWKLWPGGVVKYFWDNGIEQSARKALVEAMQHWEAKTCVTFQESQQQDYGTVTFRSSGKGCNAHVGYWSNYKSGLNLGPGCRDLGTALHELGHTIGLRHEHQRPDATEFIEIHLENAQQWWKQWLRTWDHNDDTSAGVPYDMGSIMHYIASAGKLKGKPDTITVKKPDVFGNCRIGQRAYLSEGDILTINRWYGCPDHFCADLHKKCQEWKESGDCTNVYYKKWMEANCAHTCGKCQCADSPEYASKCPGWTDYCPRGEKGQQFKDFMKKNCRSSCGMCRMEDAKSCFDEALNWGAWGTCAKLKDKKRSDGIPWCKYPYFASRCSKSCNLCPHKPYCF